MDIVLSFELPPTTSSGSVHVSAYAEGRPDLGDFDGSLSATELVGVLNSTFGPEVVALLVGSDVELSDSLSAGS